jgi:hypothetical protein
MTMELTLYETLRAMRTYVTKARNGHLVLGWRLRLWLKIKELFADASFRRNALVYLTLKDVLRYWKADMITLDCPAEWRNDYLAQPQRIVSLWRSMLLHDGTSSEVLERCRKMQGLFDYVSPFFASPFVGLVATAFSSAIWRIDDLDDQIYENAGWYSLVMDDHMIETVDDLTSSHEPEGFDSYYFASQVAAYQSSNGETEEIEARRHFWVAWIDMCVPCVLGPKEHIKSAVYEAMV